MYKDILYNIMLKLQLDDIKNLCLTNVIASTICREKSFWHDKWMKDYNEIEPYTNNYKKEYYNMDKANKIANNLLDVSLLLKKDKNCNIDNSSNNDDFFVPHDIDITGLYWLPQKLIDFIDDYEDDIYDATISFKVVDDTGDGIIIIQGLLNDGDEFEVKKV